MRKIFPFFLVLVVLFLPSFANAFWKEWKADSLFCGDVIIWERKCSAGFFGTHCSPPYEVAICNPWQVPERNVPVTTWFPEEIHCTIKRECLTEIIKVTKFLDGRGEVNHNEIHLPVKFYFEINDLPGRIGWGLSCGPTIKITTDSFERELSPKEAFSSKDFASVISERKRLDQLWAGGSLQELADFLIQYTHDNSLRLSQGKEKFFANKYSENKKESRSQTTSHRNYEKLQMGKEYEEVRKQIEYFIHFREEFDVRGYFKTQRDPITGEILDDAYCGHFGGRNPLIRPSETLISKVAYTYSPSQDRKIGPCRIEEGKRHWVKVQFCVPGDGCGPPGAPTTDFVTVDAPEPLAILAFSKEETKTKEKPLEFRAKVTRWIDTDWNGDGFPKIPKEIGADFIDFQFCGQEKIKSYDSPFAFRSLYRGKKLIYDPNSCPKDPELEPLEETKPERCALVNESCICDEKQGWCDKYCGKIQWIENLDICHPVNPEGPESLRIEKGKIGDVGEFAEKNRSSNEEPDSSICPPNSKIYFASEQMVMLGDLEEISIDWKDDPYYGILNLPYPEDLLKWDLILQYFPGNPIQNVWQVQKKESRWWSQKWHFQLTTSVPMKGVKRGDESVFEPMEKEDFRKSISFQPAQYPFKNPIYGDEPGFNRLQTLEYQKIPRVLSYKIEVFTEGGQPIKLLPAYTQLRWRFLEKFQQAQIKKFNLWEIWPCLKYPSAQRETDPQKINQARLNKVFIFNVAPCLDEWGEICIFETKFKAKTPGAPPKELFPSSTNLPFSVPRYLGVEPVPGAASYILEIDGKKVFSSNKIEFCEPGKECIDPQVKDFSFVCTPEENYCPPMQYYWLNAKEEREYKWKIRSCADVCDKIDDERFLHCGEFSEASFYGCNLSPPLEPSSPKIGEEFLPDEQITLSWEKGQCQNSDVRYGLLITYQRAPDERRNECKELEENSVKYEIGFAENTTTTNFECLGTYFWKVWKCVDEDCLETGRDSPVWYFNVVKEKTTKGGGGGGFTIGTCRKIVPDCPPGGCTIKEIPQLIFNILNCLLWTGIPVLLFIGFLATGLTLIFFATNVELLEKVKASWKGIGIGILIMLLGWTILNIIFLVLGWRKGTFGDWFNPF